MAPRIKKKRKASGLERFALKATRWIGSVQSLVVHTIIFAGVFSLWFFGISLERILIAITTIVSYEAIYLAIFIQMTVNRNTKRLYEVSKDIEEIQEDVEDIEEEEERSRMEKRVNADTLRKIETALSDLSEVMGRMQKK